MTSVFIKTSTGGTKTVYHTKRDCRYLKQSPHTIHEKDLDQLPDHLECCQRCENGGPTSSGTKDIYKAAVRAGREGSA